MLKLLLISIGFLITGIAHSQSVYTYSVTTIEGVNKSLSSYQGKKILVITLPAQQNASNDSLLHSLDSLQSIYADSLIIIAVPSYEDGYTVAIKNDLKVWYRSILSNDIVVTEGAYTRKISGSQQDPLFKWLTDKTKNTHFNKDVTGSGNKFFIWKDGELVGMLDALTKLGGTAMNELLQAQ